jgi:hypothetical protein
MREPEHDEFRAAGQALASLLLGVSIEEVTRTGVVLDQMGGSASDGQPRSETASLQAEITVDLGGIVAVDHYEFGRPEPGDISLVVSFNFNETQLADWIRVRHLASRIDPVDGLDAWFGAWDYLQGLFGEPDVAAAIDALALALTDGPLDELGVATIAAQAAKVPPPSAVR